MIVISIINNDGGDDDDDHLWITRTDQQPHIRQIDISHIACHVDLVALVIKTIGYSEPIRRDWLLIAAATLPGSSQTDTDEFFGHNIWAVTIDIKSNTRIPVVSRRGAKVWRRLVTTPAATLFVAVAGVAGHVEPGVEGVVTDQQLVRVRAVCKSVRIPQPLWLSGVAVAGGRFQIATRLSCEIFLLVVHLINKDDLCELQRMLILVSNLKL